jgi:steroid 5-alpha reductase family enzyme
MNWLDVWTLIGIASAFAALSMLILWWFATTKKDASIVDVAWSALLGLFAIAFPILAQGHPHRRILVATLGGLWGLRLASHLLLDRILKAREEDGRYQELRAKWGPHATRNFFLFFQAQGILAALLAIPFAMASQSTDPLHITDYAAAALWLVGFVGESIADRQLAAWKRDPANKGKTCRQGLWNLSRHPNYFFEWLMWCAYALLAMHFPFGFLAWAAPALMLFLILKVTGIPPTEERALRTRGDDYRHYQQTTSAFVPWFPKRERTTPTPKDSAR